MSTSTREPASTAIVTGGNTGLAYHAAAALATDTRWAVVLAVRDLARGTQRREASAATPEIRT